MGKKRVGSRSVKTQAVKPKQEVGPVMGFSDNRSVQSVAMERELEAQDKKMVMIFVDGTKSMESEAKKRRFSPGRANSTQG